MGTLAFSFLLWWRIFLGKFLPEETVTRLSIFLEAHPQQVLHPTQATEQLLWATGFVVSLPVWFFKLIMLSPNAGVGSKIVYASSLLLVNKLSRSKLTALLKYFTQIPNVWSFAREKAKPAKTWATEIRTPDQSPDKFLKVKSNDIGAHEWRVIFLRERIRDHRPSWTPGHGLVTWEGTFTSWMSMISIFGTVFQKSKLRKD